MKKPRTVVDSVTGHARRVIAGKVNEGRLVKAMCRQHLVDLNTGKARGLTWDVAAADKALDLVREVLDEELSPGEQFLIGAMFGWRAAGGTRRVLRLEGDDELASALGGDAA